MKKKAKNQKKNNYRIIIAAEVLCVLCLMALVVWQFATPKQSGQFVPPAFETAAQTGTPDVPENMGYNTVWQEEMDFKAALCGLFAPKNSEVEVYLTNLSNPDAWIRLVVLDSNGNSIGSTGILKSGQYVQTVKLSKTPAKGSAVTLKIMAYEPETYYSLGSVELETVVQ